MPTPPDEILARRRVAENPTDLNLRFLLGHCLVRLHKYKEAIAELQKARQHPGHRKQAMQLLAQAYHALGLKDQSDQTNRQREAEDHDDDDEPDDPGGAASPSPRKPIKPVDAGGHRKLPDAPGL